MDQLRVHGLSFEKNSERFLSESQLNNLIKKPFLVQIPSILQELNGVSSICEKPSYEMTDKTWIKNLMGWNFTCSDPMATSHILIASICPRKEAEIADTAKLRKYSNIKVDYKVATIRVQAFGSCSSIWAEFVKETGKKARRKKTALNILSNTSNEWQCF